MSAHKLLSKWFIVKTLSISTFRITQRSSLEIQVEKTTKYVSSITNSFYFLLLFQLSFVPSYLEIQVCELLQEALVDLHRPGVPDVSESLQRSPVILQHQVDNYTGGGAGEGEGEDTQYNGSTYRLLPNTQFTKHFPFEEMAESKNSATSIKYLKLFSY